MAKKPVNVAETLGALWQRELRSGTTTPVNDIDGEVPAAEPAETVVPETTPVVAPAPATTPVVAPARRSVGRPRKTEVGGKRVRVGADVSEELKRKLAVICAMRGTTETDYISELISGKIERDYQKIMEGTPV